jgi:hypothetical protein
MIATQSVPVPLAMASLRRDCTRASSTAVVRASTATLSASISAVGLSAALTWQAMLIVPQPESGPGVSPTRTALDRPAVTSATARSDTPGTGSGARSSETAATTIADATRRLVHIPTPRGSIAAMREASKAIASTSSVSSSLRVSWIAIVRAARSAPPKGACETQACGPSARSWTQRSCSSTRTPA